MYFSIGGLLSNTHRNTRVQVCMNRVYNRNSLKKKHGVEFLLEYTGKPVNYIGTQENEMLCSTAT